MDKDGDGADDARVNEQIDANLRRVYREIVGDDVPDRFRLLLDQLRRQDEPDDAGAAGAGEAGMPRASGGGRA
jgi:hypothetical protein